MNQNSSGPWGPWSGAGSGAGNDSAKNSTQGAPKFSAQEKNSNNAGNGGSNNGGNSGGNFNKNGPGKFDSFMQKISNFFQQNKSPKQLASLITLGFITLWLASGFYKINPDENGIILYFGKFYSVATPGLNYYAPFPFGELIKKSVTTVNTEEFGYNSTNRNGDKRELDAESLMLTGDENIVDIEFQVQWQISNIEEFSFNVAEPHLTIRKAAESAMREVIARTPISEALSDGKSKIEQATRELLQTSLNSYKTGVRVVLVQLRRVDPPSQVIDAFRDVQTAKADKEKEINQAQAYSNDIIPRARGAAAQMQEQAEAYKQEVVTNAEGESDRFLAVYRQYVKAKKLTRKRLYLETMEKIYRENEKVFIDKGVSKTGVTPYFPLNDITQPKPKPTT